MSKFTQKEILRFAKFTAFLLVVSVVLSLLYTLDWFSETVFLFLTEALGFLFYIFMGFMLTNLLKKRVLLVGIAISAILIALSFLLPYTLTNSILLAAKNFAFLATILLFKRK